MDQMSWDELVKKLGAGAPNGSIVYNKYEPKVKFWNTYRIPGQYEFGVSLTIEPDWKRSEVFLTLYLGARVLELGLMWEEDLWDGKPMVTEWSSIDYEG